MTLSKSDRLNDNNDIKYQLAKLDRQLITYQIVDRQGISTGEVKDIYYDANNELNLLIELVPISNKISLRRLEPNDICQIDSTNRSILSNLSHLELENLPLYQPVPSHLRSNLSETYQIPLLEEKLQIARRKQKIGEVVVRKQVETRIVKVPIRREKLIVERIGKNPQQLTEVVIGGDKVNGFKYEELGDRDSLHITKSYFLDLQTARELLEAIANLSSANNAKVRLEIVTNCSEHQIEHQNLCDRFQ